jgi:hypothetical protein
MPVRPAGIAFSNIPASTILVIFQLIIYLFKFQHILKNPENNMRIITKNCETADSKKVQKPMYSSGIHSIILKYEPSINYW